MAGNLGPGLKALLDTASMDGLLAVLRKAEDDDEPSAEIFDVATLLDDAGARAYLTENLANQHPELLQPIEDRCIRILQMAERKGPTSLKTMVEQRLHDDEVEEYEDQNDDLSRSIWAWLGHRKVFAAAESFHNARRYRDHGRLYDAFEVDLDMPVGNSAAEVDIAALEAALEARLDLRQKCVVIALDLPATQTRAFSVMLIVRAGGLKSSVTDFVNGTQRQIYFRPPNEATLIWTPSQCRMEICSDSPPQREEICNGFAEVVLKHDISKKPITWRRYDLSRFRTSLALDLPTIDGFEITMARVIEAEVRLGTWSRKLALKVALEDDIAAVARDHLGPNNVFLRAAAITRVAIAVRFSRDGDEATGTLNLTVSSGNRSNVQSHKDPVLRSLGQSLLAAWGILKPFRNLTEEEGWSSLPLLLALFDYPEDEVTADFLRDHDVDPDKLTNAGLIERADRQDVVLLDDDDDGEVEARIEPAKQKQRSKLVGEYEELYGLCPTGNFDRYRIRRGWLDQSVNDLLQSVVPKPTIQSLDANLYLLGSVTIDGSTLPLYLARRLYSEKLARQVNEKLRSRSSAGPGIVLSASPQPPNLLGSNVVIDLKTLWVPGSTGIRLEDFALVYRSGRNLAQGGEDVHFIHGEGQSANLILPGKPTFLVTGHKQIIIIKRLVDAHKSQIFEVRTGDLVAGTGVKSPRDAWTGKERKLAGTYIENSRRNFWRLAVAGTSAT